MGWFTGYLKLLGSTTSKAFMVIRPRLAMAD
jgi:hypothetical protein